MQQLCDFVKEGLKKKKVELLIIKMLEKMKKKMAHFCDTVNGLSFGGKVS